MVSLVLPQAGGLIFVLIGAVAFFFIHYLLWGRLLTRLREQDRDEKPPDDWAD